MALQLTDLFARLAEAGEAALVRAQVEEAWAVALREKQPEAAQEHFCASGAAYAAATAGSATAVGRAAAWRRAAAMYREGQNYPKAVELLRNYVAGQAVADPESAGTGQLEL